MSDMLASCYQIVDAETDLLKSLLKLCAPEIVTSTTKKWLGSLSEALCAPLKLRVEQTLTRETNCVVLYRLSSLFLYYASQFEYASARIGSRFRLRRLQNAYERRCGHCGCNSRPSRARLQHVLFNDQLDGAENSFDGWHGVDDESSCDERSSFQMSTPDYDLMPVSAVHQTLLLLRDILESQNDYAFTAVAEKKETHTRIFAALLDPLNQSVGALPP